MENMMTTSIVEISFNEAVNNINKIIREANHLPVDTDFRSELSQFEKFINDVNFKVSFVEDSYEYLHEKMLDAMDYILYEWLANIEKDTPTFRVANSIYDVIKEWYFNE